MLRDDAIPALHLNKLVLTATQRGLVGSNLMILDSEIALQADSDVPLSGYIIYSVGRGGGVALYVKCCLNVSVSL